MPWKYLINFWRSLEMPLIISKIELKFKWIKYYVLSAAGKDSTNDYPDNIVFTIQDTKLYVTVVASPAKYD